MPRIVRSKDARQDVAEIWHYIALQNESAADRVFENIDRAVRLIAELPGIAQLAKNSVKAFEAIRFSRT